MPGFGVPLASGKQKSDLVLPLERGVYAISSIDQKSVLKLRVFSREDIQFRPEPILNSEFGRSLSDEARDRIAATWTILQLTVESHSPKTQETLIFLANVTSRLAKLCQGMVADPLCEIYRHPDAFPDPGAYPGEVSILDFVQCKKVPGPEGWLLSTAGLRKFDHPELAISRVPSTHVGIAESFLISVASGILKGHYLQLGDKLVSNKGWIVSNYVPATNLEIFELMPLDPQETGAALTQWMTSNDKS